MRGADKPLLISISVTSIQNEPYVGPDMRLAQSANIRGKSEESDACFDMKTGLLNPEQIKRCELLRQHGSTVVEVPHNWRYSHNGPGSWIDDVIHRAMDQVATLYQDGEGEKRMAGYNEELAKTILEVANKKHPTRISGQDLKHNLQPEPSDEEFFTALDALHIDGYLNVVGIRSGIYNKLGDVAFVAMTTEGRRYMNNQANPIPTSGPVFHGDQINNYGHAGAMGRHSVGTINQQQQFAAIANQVDLSQVVTELQTLKAELMKTAKTPTDFQQLGLVAEAEQYAEKQDGSKVMEVLSKAGKDLFDFAKDVGVEITAKLLAKSMGLEP